jgi:hypothetical protein
MRDGDIAVVDRGVLPAPASLCQVLTVVAFVETYCG